MKRKIFLLLPFLLLAITKCEETKKRRRRNSDRKRVKIKKRPSKLYRMKQVGVVAVPAIIILLIGYEICRPKSNNSSNADFKDAPDLNTIIASPSPKKKGINEDEKDSLFNACSLGDLQRVEKFVKNYEIQVILKAKRNRHTFLHVAAKEGHLDVVNLLLGAIKDKNEREEYLNKTKTTYGATLLQMACERGHLGVVKHLVEQGASLKIKGSGDKYPAYWACKNEHFDIVKYFVREKGVKPNDDLGNGYTLLHVAGRHGNLDIVQYLWNEIKKEEQADALKAKTEIDEYTPLFEAMCNENFEVFKFLWGKITEDKDKIEALNAKYIQGKTLLRFTVDRGFEAFKFLLSQIKKKKDRIEALNTKIGGDRFSFLLSVDAKYPKKIKNYLNQEFKDYEVLKSPDGEMTLIPKKKEILT